MYVYLGCTFDKRTEYQTSRFTSTFVQLICYEFRRIYSRFLNALTRKNIPYFARSISRSLAKVRHNTTDVTPWYVYNRGHMLEYELHCVLRLHCVLHLDRDIGKNGRRYVSNILNILTTKKRWQETAPRINSLANLL